MRRDEIIESLNKCDNGDVFFVVIGADGIYKVYDILQTFEIGLDIENKDVIAIRAQKAYYEDAH